MQLIKKFFYPDSLALIGASTKEKSIGFEILKSIKSYGYQGKVYPVNPKADKILEYKCYHSINEIKNKIDLAIVVVPKKFVEESIEILPSKNVKSNILITASFKEIGKEGEEIENRIIAKIKENRARLIGPNCMGVINTLDTTKLNATFVAEKPQKGSTGFLSQSGALAAAVLNSLRETNIKFAHLISVGNKADINENDILNFWQKDPNIRTITFYLESFVDGLDFIKLFAEGKITKSTIVLKAGNTTESMKAASSHTGALSSSDNVVDSLLKQFGIIRVKDLNELFNTAKGFENFAIPKGNRIAVITNAGGPAILTIDALNKFGLKLAELSKSTKLKLKKVVHPEGSVENPVDLLPGGDVLTYKTVNKIITQDDNVDAVISIFVEPVMVKPFDVVESINNLQQKKPIFQVVMPLPEFWEKYRLNSKKQIPLFKNPEDPAKVLSNMIFYSKKRDKIKNNLREYKSLINISNKSIENFKSGFLSTEEAQKLFTEYKIPVVKNLFVAPEQISRLIDIEFPIVVKGLNKKITHKSELNAVKLNIKNKDELLPATSSIKRSFNKIGYKIEKFQIQPYIIAKHEILIGGYRDFSFGPIIMFGSGGKYVEVYNDSSLISAFCSEEDINEMINNTSIGKILKGVRGEKSTDISELKRIIKQAAIMLIENKQIDEFDINPLLLSMNGGFTAVDVRVKMK